MRRILFVIAAVILSLGVAVPAHADDTWPQTVTIDATTQDVWDAPELHCFADTEHTWSQLGTRFELNDDAEWVQTDQVTMWASADESMCPNLAAGWVAPDVVPVAEPAPGPDPDPGIPSPSFASAPFGN